MIAANVDALRDALRTMSGASTTMRKFCDRYIQLRQAMCADCPTPTALFADYQQCKSALVAAWQGILTVDQATEPIPPPEEPE